MINFKSYNTGYYIILISGGLLIIMNVIYLLLNKCSDNIYYLITIVLLALLLFGSYQLQSKILRERADAEQHLNNLYGKLIKDGLELMKMQDRVMNMVDKMRKD